MNGHDLSNVIDRNNRLFEEVKEQIVELRNLQKETILLLKYIEINTK